MKINCKRCKKEVEISTEQLEYLRKKSKELKTELVLPKLCNECRLTKEQIKSIPMKIQSICNDILNKSKDNEVNNNVMLIFGLARKQMRDNLVNYRFIDSVEK